MKSAKIVKPREFLEMHDTEIPKPRGSEVLVRVVSAGVCHSDIHLWEGGYEGPEGQFLKTTDRGVPYPLTPGHEIAGIVEDMGEDISSAGNKGITKNEEVVVYPWIGEGVCPACRGGEENLCDYPKSLGIYSDGGYAEFVLVPHYKYLIKINSRNDSFDDSIGEGSSNLDMDTAATLPCSALTAYSAVKNAILKPNDNVVIVGAGGLGLMAIQLAKAVTGANVIAIDLDDDKLKTAKEKGADLVINSRTDDPAKMVREMTDKLGADAVIDFVNSTSSAEKDMQLLRRRARLVFVGFFGGELKLNLVTIPTGAYRLVGSYTGSLNDLVDLVSLAKRRIIKPLVSNRFKLNQATEALQMLRDRKITGRAVINP